MKRNDAAFTGYRSAIALAQRAGDPKLESLALAHLADLQEKTGDVKSAAESYQRGLALDAKSADPHAEALDWFNYGQFLRGIICPRVDLRLFAAFRAIAGEHGRGGS